MSVQSVSESGAASAPDIIVRADERGVILSVSATCAVLGYEPRDLVGLLGIELVHPDDRERFIENTASIFRPDGASAGLPRVHRIRRKDGSWAWLRGHPRLLRTQQNGTAEFVNFFEPISEGEAAEAFRLA